MLFDGSKLKTLFLHQARRGDCLFDNIYGFEDVKRLFRMALQSTHSCSILLTGPPASAKTLFLQSLIKLKDSHFIDCSNATKSGVVEYVFEKRPKYLLLDELDKLSRKDQTFLLNLMETGIVSETKYNKTRKIEIKTSVFATSNSIERIIPPLQSRFFVVKLQAYTFEQFNEITSRLLLSSRFNVDDEIVKAIARAVWDSSRNLRDCLRIGGIAKSTEDVSWLGYTFLKST
jgi:replication-associated recombination protein RarA